MIDNKYGYYNGIPVATVREIETHRIVITTNGTHEQSE